MKPFERFSLLDLKRNIVNSCPSSFLVTLDRGREIIRFVETETQ